MQDSENRNADRPKDMTPERYVVDQANRFDREWLQDIARAVPYHRFAKQCASFEEFSDYRQLAFLDLLSERSDEEKAKTIWGASKVGRTHHKIAIMRGKELYGAICELIDSALETHAEPLKSEDWLGQTEDMAWRRIRREIAGSSNPKVAHAAATAVIDRTLPKVARSPKESGGVTINFPAEIAEKLVEGLGFLRREEKQIVDVDPEVHRRLAPGDPGRGS